MKTTINFILAVVAFIASSLIAQAQVKIGTNTTVIAPGSALEVESADKGIRMPQVSLTNTTTWAPVLGTGTVATSPGMHVYNTNPSITSTNEKYPTLDQKIGEYYWDGTGWVAIGQTQSADAALRVSMSTSTLVNSGIVYKVNYTTTEFDKNSNFNLSTDEFTTPSSGFYLVSFYIESTANVASGTGRAAFIYVNGALYRKLINDFVPANTGFSRTIPVVVKLSAGDKVTMQVQSNPSFADWTYSVSSLEIVKLSN
ncbi:hypothetical protein [Spirosoma radiotolerans]|nr:hypothetical protein [Spirosoma radiotolerans]